MVRLELEVQLAPAPGQGEQVQQRQERPVSGIALVIAGLVSQEAGAANGVLLFPLVGPTGAVGLRIALSALLLWIAARPSVRGHSRQAWQHVIAYGLVLAAMNITFYLSINRLPLGIAVTIEVLGPLTLSVASRLGARSVAIALLALGGVALLGIGEIGQRMDPLGVLFAAIAATCWAGYILLTRRLGTTFPGIQGLTLGMTVAAIAAAPLALINAGSTLFTPAALLAGLALAVLSSAIPYTAELLALRRLNASTFSVLATLAPVIAAAFGIALLHQTLSPLSWTGIALVVTASAAAVAPARTRLKNASAAGTLPPRSTEEP